MAFTGRGRRADDKELKYADSPVAVPLNNYQGACWLLHRVAPRQRRRARPEGTRPGAFEKAFQMWLCDARI